MQYSSSENPALLNQFTLFGTFAYPFHQATAGSLFAIPPSSLSACPLHQTTAGSLFAIPLNFRLKRCSSDLIVSRLSSSNLTNSLINRSFLTSKTICFIIFQMPFGRISRSQKFFKAFEIDMESRDLRKTFFFSLIPRCCFILLLALCPGATTSSRLSEYLHFVHSTILLCRIQLSGTE